MRRIRLDAQAWIDHHPRWLSGDTALFETLRAATCWTASRRWMYDREVDVPRLTALLPEDGEGHPVVWAMSDALSSRYGRPLDRVSLALYRHGADSVAWHADTMHRSAFEERESVAAQAPAVAAAGGSRVAAAAQTLAVPVAPRRFAPAQLEQLIVAIVALGEPRRFLLRRAGASGEASRAFSLGWGDLIVMGPGCQTRYEHAVPKAKRAGPRIALMFRPRDVE